MNIGEASQASGLPVKTIRYYEDVGLIAPNREANGYRDFAQADIARLKFLSQARSLGFPLEDCRKLLALQSDPGRASREVRDVARHHLEQVREKIEELQSVATTLENLVAACPGNDSSNCAILDELTGSVLDKLLK